MLKSQQFLQEVEETLEDGSLLKAHNNNAMTLLKRLSQFKSYERIPAEQEEDLDDICKKLADTFSQESFEKAIKTFTRKVHQVKTTLKTSN